MDTYYNPNRKVYESEFLTLHGQHQYLLNRRHDPIQTSLYDLKQSHRGITRLLFKPESDPHKERERINSLRRQYETVQDLATVLKDRNALPVEFEPFVLNTQDLPWNEQSHTSLSEPPRS